jgi:hypothetical protein
VCAGTVILTIGEDEMPQIKEDAIRIEAYQIWEAEGRPEGCAEAHWLAAEQQVANKSRRSQPRAKLEQQVRDEIELPVKGSA